jgi:hypothetical protein
VTRCAAPTEFELELVVAMDDWIGTRIGFTLEPHGEVTQVRFDTCRAGGRLPNLLILLGNVRPDPQGYLEHAGRGLRGQAGGVKGVSAYA